jgi:hypothetical protein
MDLDPSDYKTLQFIVVASYHRPIMPPKIDLFGFFPHFA